jgi:hypothetical protein
MWLRFLRTAVARQFPCPKPITTIRDGAVVIKMYDDLDNAPSGKPTRSSVSSNDEHQRDPQRTQARGHQRQIKASPPSC